MAYRYFPTLTQARLETYLGQLDTQSLTPYVTAGGVGETSWQRNDMSKGQIARIRNEVLAALNERDPVKWPGDLVLPNQTQVYLGGNL